MIISSRDGILSSMAHCLPRRTKRRRRFWRRCVMNFVRFLPQRHISGRRGGGATEVAVAMLVARTSVCPLRRFTRLDVWPMIVRTKRCCTGVIFDQTRASRRPVRKADAKAKAQRQRKRSRRRIARQSTGFTLDKSSSMLFFLCRKGAGAFTLLPVACLGVKQFCLRNRA